MDRELTEPERAVLAAILERGHEVTPGAPISDVDRRSWLAQLDHSRVVGRCTCGQCPSVELAILDDIIGGDTARNAVLGASTEHALLLAFIDDGRLSYLELAPIDPDAVVSEFPPVDELELSPPRPIA